MEPPAKRRKRSQGLVETEDDDDELFLAPEVLNQKRDPAYQLEQKRDLAANKLKFRFQSIFDKYEKDFTGIGDEISNATGEVVVDNGHLRSMRNAKDVGDGQDDDDENSSEEEERILRGVNAARKVSSAEPSNSSTGPRDPWQVAGPSGPEPAMGGSGRLTSLFSSRLAPSRPFTPFGLGSRMTVDPAWETPDIPESAFHRGFGGNEMQSGFGMGSSTPTRTVARRMLPAPPNLDTDDEDVLLGVSGYVLENNNKKSPLIKEKFPAIDSSPHEDPEQIGRIMDLIENSPPTPSSSIQRPRIPKRRGRPSKLRETVVAGSETDSQEKLRRRPSRPRKETNKDSVALAAANAEYLGLEKKEVQATQNGQSCWDDSDLEIFRDVTSLGFKKPVGQVLYVDIRTLKGDSSEPSGGDGDDIIRSSVSGEAPLVDETTNAQSSIQATEPMAGDISFPNPGEESATPSRNAEETATSSKSAVSQETFQRNIVDPAFDFSDEETLLPKRARKQRRQSELATMSVTILPEQQDIIAEPREQEMEQEVEHNNMETFDADNIEGLNYEPIGSITSTRNTDRPESGQEESKAVDAQLTPASERNTVDPSCTFSVKESLMSRKAKRGPRKSEPVALTEPPTEETSAAEPQAEQGATKTRARRRSMRISSKAVTESTRSNQDETMLDASFAADEEPTGSESQDFQADAEEQVPAINTVASRPSRLQKRTDVPVLLESKRSPPTEPSLEHRSPDVGLSASRPRGRGRPKRKLNAELPELQLPKATGQTHAVSEAEVNVATPQSSLQKNVETSGTKHLSAEGVPYESMENIDETSKRLSLRPRTRRRSTSQRRPSLELGDSSPINMSLELGDPSSVNTFLEVGDLSPADKIPAAMLSAHEQSTLFATATEPTARIADTAANVPKSRPPNSPSTTGPKSASKGIAAALQPATPRSKSKNNTNNKKIAIESAKSLMSLLSDNDDSEDEISFDLADFTPSGHHRIIVHRPFFPGLIPTSASSGSKSTTKKQQKKRAKLLFGSHTQSSGSKPKTPRTPSSTQRARKTDLRRTSLARSVVRVENLRDSDGVGGGGSDSRAASPLGEVVQTPGGTKRRCGEDGFVCNRDFCFVCL